MKIAVTARGAGLGAWLDESFAHCMQIVVVDEKDRFEAWDNPYREEQEEIAADKLANWFIQADIPVLITKAIPQKERRKIEQNGIRVVIAENGAVLDLVEKVRQNPPIEESNPC